MVSEATGPELKAVRTSPGGARWSPRGRSKREAALTALRRGVRTSETPAGRAGREAQKTGGDAPRADVLWLGEEDLRGQQDGGGFKLGGKGPSGHREHHRCERRHAGNRAAAEEDGRNHARQRADREQDDRRRGPLPVHHGAIVRSSGSRGSEGRMTRLLRCWHLSHGGEIMRTAGVACLALFVSGVAAVDASTPKGGKEADEIGYVML